MLVGIRSVGHGTNSGHCVNIGPNSCSVRSITTSGSLRYWIELELLGIVIPKARTMNPIPARTSAIPTTRLKSDS